MAVERKSNHWLVALILSGTREVVWPLDFAREGSWWLPSEEPGSGKSTICIYYLQSCNRKQRTWFFFSVNEVVREDTDWKNRSSRGYCHYDNPGSKETNWSGYRKPTKTSEVDLRCQNAWRLPDDGELSWNQGKWHHPRGPHWVL